MKHYSLGFISAEVTAALVNLLLSLELFLWRLHLTLSIKEYLSRGVPCAINSLAAIKALSCMPCVCVCECARVRMPEAGRVWQNAGPAVV